MVALRRLALRLPREPVEPAHGPLLRISARYGTPPERPAARWGLSLGGLVRASGVDRFTAIAGADPAVVSACSPVVWTRERRVLLGGEKLLLGDGSVSTRRWCPACFGGDARRSEHAACHRAWWDVRSVGVCPTHLVMP